MYDEDPSRKIIDQWPLHCRIVQGQTAVAAYLKSKQLLLFVFVR